MRRIGKLKLDRVVESEEPLIVLVGFFPESTPDVFADMPNGCSRDMWTRFRAS
jgi:hypothetical protein